MEVIAVACRLPQGRWQLPSCQILRLHMAALAANEDVDVPTMLFQTIHKYAS
jgi:hypothetical protein